MSVTTNRWDAASALDTPERIAIYLEEAFADGDAQLIVAAMEDVARVERDADGPAGAAE